MKPFRDGLVIIAMGFLGTGAWLVARSNPAIVPLPGGQEMRILKVSLATNHMLSLEPLWKQTLRHLLPETLQKPMGRPAIERRYTRGEALVVWVDGGKKAKGAPFILQEAAAVFTNGVIAKTTVPARPGLHCLEFTCFERGSALVPLRVRCQNASIDFTVRNPRPVRAAEWIAMELPQTQQVAKASVVLSGLRPRPKGDAVDDWEAFLGARGPGVGWNWWRITVYDRWGNYRFGEFKAKPPVSFPSLPRGRSPWRLRAEGQEFLSAARIQYPTGAVSRVIFPKPRMQELGIRFLLLVGVGNYTVTNGAQQVAVQFVSDPGAGSRAIVMETPGKAHGALTLRIGAPGVLCVSELSPALSPPRIRLHERDERDEGRTYGCKSFTATNTIAGVQCLAQFFVLPQLPLDPANEHEVEVISEFAADFFVDPADILPAASDLTRRRPSLD